MSFGIVLAPLIALHHHLIETHSFVFEKKQKLVFSLVLFVLVFCERFLTLSLFLVSWEVRVQTLSVKLFNLVF